MAANRITRAEMSHIAMSAGPVESRADALLRCLRGVVPYAAAWISVLDPETRVHRRVGSDGDTDPLARFFADPEADAEVEALGLNRSQPPVRASALPVPLEDSRSWGEYLLPAGFRDGVAMPVFSADGRHLGFVSLLTDELAPQRVDSYVRLLAGLRPVFVEALDRLPAFAAAARITGDALGGVVVTRTGRTLPIPGMPVHPVIADDTEAIALARRHARTPGTRTSFLSPWAGELLRVTVLDCRDDAVDHLSSLVLVRPADDAMELGLSDLQLLGALVEGWDDDRIRAGTRLARPSDDAAHLAGHLGLPSEEALVQHAAREGLYLPPSLWHAVGQGWRGART